MDYSGIDKTLEMMDEIALRNIDVVFEEVKPYQHGTERKTFNLNDWKKLIFKTK